MSTSTNTASTMSPMQQELLNRADKIFDWIGNSVDKVSDLAIQGGQVVAQQIPDIAFQYVTYGRVILTMYILLGFFMYFMAYYTVIRIGIRDTMKLGTVQGWGGSDWHPLRSVFAITGGVTGCLIGSLLIFVNLKQAILVWFAPKVWLMLELVELVKMVKS